jgi:hypothetical protein
MLNKNFDSKFDKIPLRFDAKELGTSFVEVAVDIVRGENIDFINRWFRAKGADADLMIWIDSEKRMIKHQISFYGQVVEWNAIHGTRTGLIVEEELSQVGSNPSTLESQPNVAETIRFDEKTQTHAVLQAVNLINHIPGFSDSERAALSFNFRESPKLHKNARERALKAWAPEGHEIVSHHRPSFWRRLRRWVVGS